MDNVIIERARAAMKDTPTKEQRAIASEMGISYSGFRRILAGGSCTVRSLAKIATRYGTEHERQLLGLVDRRAAQPAEATPPSSTDAEPRAQQ